MDLPFEVFISFLAIALFIGTIGIVMGLRKIDGAPFITIFAGILIFTQMTLTSNLIMEYGFSTDIGQTQYEVISTSSSQALRQDTVNTWAEFVSAGTSKLAGLEVNCMDVPIAKVGLPDFNTPIILGVFDSSGNIKYEFGRMNVTILTTGAQFFKICNEVQNYQIVNLDRLGVRWNDGNATSNIVIRDDNSDPFDGTVTFLQSFNDNTDTWTSFTTRDLTMILTLQEGTAGVLEATYAFDSNETWAYMITLSALFIFVGVIFQVKHS